VRLVVGQALAVLFVLAFSPLYRGVLERWRARLFFRVGPPIIQPYRDLRKWFSKELVRSERATWVSALAPVVYFCAPLIVALLIPVLTRRPLPLAFMADMLGGGFVLGAGGFFLLLHALDTGSPYAGLATSRIRLVGVFVEPLITLIVFAAATVAASTIPFVVNATLAQPRWLASPAHVILMVAWFLFWIAETGRIPVDNPGSTAELSLIDPGRVFGHFMAKLGAKFRRAGYRFGGVGMNWTAVERPGVERDPKPPRGIGDFIEPGPGWRRRDIRIARHRSGGRVKHRGRVAHRARHHVFDYESVDEVAGHRCKRIAPARRL